MGSKLVVELVPKRPSRKAKQAPAYTTAARAASPRERAFAAHYVSGKGLRESAILAGYAPAGAHGMATLLVRRPHVQALIAEAYAAEGGSPAEVAARVWAIARFDPSVLLECEGLIERDAEGRTRVNGAKLRSLGIGPLIKAIKYTAEGDVVIEWHSQAEALALLAKVYGMTRETIRHEIADMRALSDDELYKLARGG